MKLTEWIEKQNRERMIESAESADRSGIERKYVKIGNLIEPVVPLEGNQFRFCRCGGKRTDHEDLVMERGGLGRTGCEIFVAAGVDGIDWVPTDGYRSQRY